CEGRLAFRADQGEIQLLVGHPPATGPWRLLPLCGAARGREGHRRTCGGLEGHTRSSSRRWGRARTCAPESGRSPYSRVGQRVLEAVVAARLGDGAWSVRRERFSPERALHELEACYLQALSIAGR